MKNKIGIFGVFNEVTSSSSYHSYGYVRTLILQLKHLCKYDQVDLLNYKSDLNEYDQIFIDEGVNFEQYKWNKIGGDFTKVLSNIEKLNNFNGKIYYNNLKVIPDYEHLINKRKLDINYNKKEFHSIDFVSLSDGLILGDSHSTSVYTQGYAINTINGKTMNSFINDGFKMYVPDNIKKLILYCGNIDIRFHLHRLNVNINDFVKKLEIELLKLNINKIAIIGPLFIENESRKIPTTGLYKKQAFYGSFEQRNNIRTEFINELENMCIRNNFKLIQWNDKYKNELGELDFKYMEPKGSVHLKPDYYMYGKSII